MKQLILALGLVAVSSTAAMADVSMGVAVEADGNGAGVATQGGFSFAGVTVDNNTSVKVSPSGAIKSAVGLVKKGVKATKKVVGTAASLLN